MRAVRVPGDDAQVGHAAPDPTARCGGRRRPGGLFRLGARLRHLLWKLVLTVTGGLRVSGALPAGPLVIVANHGSHADTAALLAALPARRRPVAAAAAEYWFGLRWRRLLVQSLVAALPVARGRSGAYAALRAAAGPVLGRGDIVIVFPEGTRSADGSIAAFKPGALRLAAELGVPVVPVALRGSREILPKHGRVCPQPVEVRVGAPIAPGALVADSAGAAVLRERVCELYDQGPARAPESRTFRWAARRAAAPTLLALSFTWGVAEAVSWPVLAEMYLVLWVACHPRRILPAALALVVGSVVGVVVHAQLVRHGIVPPLPLTTPRMAAVAAQQLAEQGPLAIWHQLFNGIPVKVYAAQAGAGGTDLGVLALWTALFRGARILTVALVVRALARRLQPTLQRAYGPYLLVAAGTCAVVLHGVIAKWS